MKEEKVFVRLDLMKQEILPKLVYYNAIGFLMIKAENLTHSKTFDILDRTRIHPELYSVAKWMCKSALDNSDAVDIVEKAM